MNGAELGGALRRRDHSVAPAVLNLLESTRTEDRAQAANLMAAISPSVLGREAAGHIIGLTGPPGVGKSTLLGALTGHWRRAQRSVAVLAVDPSSMRSGGALLGDRVRITHDAADAGVFIRSTATGGRLGGVAVASRDAAQALAVAFDVVVVETVGVGQSETEIAGFADTVAVVVQPGSGDVLQFLKAGIMETPDVLVIAKADLGAVADATLRDARAALRSLAASGTQAVAVSAIAPEQGIGELIAALDAHRASIDLHARRLGARRAGALADFIADHGDLGLRAVGGRRAAHRILGEAEPGLDTRALARRLVTVAERARSDIP